MKTQALDNGTTSYLIVLDAGDELMASLLAFAHEHAEGRLVDFTGVGAISSAHLLAFDLESKQYQTSAVIDEQAEIASLIGNIGQYEEDRLVHAHVVVGLRDGRAFGGHVKELHARPTCEIVARVHDREAIKRMDPQWNAPLYKLAQS